MEMTIEKLILAYPDIMKAFEGGIYAKGFDAGKEQGAKEGFQNGAAAERQRIIDVRARLLPGHEALIESLVADGKTTGLEAADKVLSAEREIRKGELEKFKQDGKEAKEVGAGMPPLTDPKPEAKDFEKEVAKVMAEKKCSRGQAIKAVAAESPELHTAWLQKLNPGKEVK